MSAYLVAQEVLYERHCRHRPAETDIHSHRTNTGSAYQAFMTIVQTPRRGCQECVDVKHKPEGGADESGVGGGVGGGAGVLIRPWN